MTRAEIVFLVGGYASIVAVLALFFYLMWREM